jgi:hypothetical protein
LFRGVPTYLRFGINVANVTAEQFFQFEAQNSKPKTLSSKLKAQNPKFKVRGRFLDFEFWILSFGIA